MEGGEQKTFVVRKINNTDLNTSKKSFQIEKKITIFIKISLEKRNKFSWVPFFSSGDSFFFFSSTRFFHSRNWIPVLHCKINVCNVLYFLSWYCQIQTFSIAVKFADSGVTYIHHRTLFFQFFSSIAQYLPKWAQTLAECSSIIYTKKN